MQTYVEYVMKGLIENPDSMEIETEDKEGLTVFKVKLHPDDMGKVIGKQGNTINAIRGLLQAGSAKADTRCVLEVSELEV
jgi:predicted RNA-binding protein YlqC (UPF0109 family)